MAGSAPILQFPDIYDCNGFFDTVTRDLREYSEDCAQSINNSWPAIRRLANDEHGRAWLQDNFQICESLNEDSAIETFVGWLNGIYTNLAMTDYPNAATFLAPLPAYPMKELCKKLPNPNQDDKSLLLDIFEAISIFTNYTGSGGNCNSLAPNGMDMGWNVQSCYEMVMPICQDNSRHVFENAPWNLTATRQACFDQYKTWPETRLIETLYGGYDISTASNIIFSNGERDPWGPGGVLKQLSPDIVLITVPNACHHEDLRPTGPNDPPALKVVRDQEASIIRGWIDGFYLRKGHFPYKWKFSRD